MIAHVTLAFTFACVTILAIGLWAERRTQTPSPVDGTGPSPVSSPTTGEGTQGTKLAGRYWLTDQDYAALREHDGETS